MKNIEKYKFKEFTYVKYYNSGDNKGIIEHNKNKPEYLFKFYALTEYSVDAFVKGYFYASHPIELNDCLDSSPFLFFTSKPLDFELYEKFLGFAYKENMDELKKFYEDDCSKENLCKGYISNLYSIATNLFGIISTTERENNPLMWPHYTQEKGFQIKFNTAKMEQSIESKITDDEEYLGLYPINYTDKLEPIDISEFQTMLIPLYYATNIKSEQWNYENEWRFLVGKQQMGVPYSKSGLDPREDWSVHKENRYIYYDNNLIEEICLGVNFFNGKEFELKWLDDKSFRIKVKPKKDNRLSEPQNRLLDYIAIDLKDKLYYSGIKYELDENEKHFLIRTKERLEIKKEEDGFYILSRTNQIIKMMDKASL
jgi:hypothetical protein